MTTTSSSTERPAGSHADLGKKAKKPKIPYVNLKLIIGILLVFASAIAILKALLEGDLLWLVTIPDLPAAAGDIATLLAPLAAVSLAIERMIETAFDTFEQSPQIMADVLEAPKEALDWIGREYQEAHKALQNATEAIGISTSDDSLKTLEAAEDRLAKAKERLQSWTSSSEYKATKRALSVWIGLLAGLVVAILGDLKMLNTIRVSAPRLLDMIVTGLVIGAGPGPMHSIVGILQGGKDALEKFATVTEDKEVKEALEELKTAIKERQT